MKYFILFFAALLTWSCNRNPETMPVVKFAGAMRNITEHTDTSSHIFLDTINPHQHLYGLGPLAGMSGEILIIDGRPYASKINRKRLNKIRQTYLIKSPYFVYAHVRDWKTVDLPDSVYTNKELEKTIISLAKRNGIDTNKPFPFLIKGTFNELAYRISYLAKKNKKHKPDPETTFTEKNLDAVVLGFYSEKHQGIFTPEGSNIIMAFMTTNATQIGQIGNLTLHGKRVQLLLPQ